ncbi:helix-turn-helix domain-containing protein [Leucobacter sp. HY1908]
MSTDIFRGGDPKHDLVYAEEAAKIDAAERIAAALERSGVSRAELARRLGVSRAEITRRLKGEHNIGVGTLAATLHVLGETLSLNRHVGVTGVADGSSLWRLPGATAPRRISTNGVWARAEGEPHA